MNNTLEDNNFKLNTVKGRLMVTLVAFALVGGGVMVYQSFADTLVRSISASELSCSTSIGPCAVKTETSVNNARVIELLANGQVSVNPEVSFSKGLTYKACIFAKATGGTATLDVPIAATSNAITMSTTNDYQKACTKGITVNDTLMSGGKGQIGNQGPASVRIMTYTIELNSTTGSD